MPDYILAKTLVPLGFPITLSFKITNIHKYSETLKLMRIYLPLMIPVASEKPQLVVLQNLAEPWSKTDQMSTWCSPQDCIINIDHL